MTKTTPKKVEIKEEVPTELKAFASEVHRRLASGEEVEPEDAIETTHAVGGAIDETHELFEVTFFPPNNDEARWFLELSQSELKTVAEKEKTSLLLWSCEGEPDCEVRFSDPNQRCPFCEPFGSSVSSDGATERLFNDIFGKNAPTTGGAGTGGLNADALAALFTPEADPPEKRPSNNPLSAMMAKATSDDPDEEEDEDTTSGPSFGADLAALLTQATQAQRTSPPEPIDDDVSFDETEDEEFNADAPVEEQEDEETEATPSHPGMNHGRRFFDLLVSMEIIEQSETPLDDAAVVRLVEILDDPYRSASSRSKGVWNWLMTEDVVDDVFASPDEVSKLVRQW